MAMTTTSGRRSVSLRRYCQASPTQSSPLTVAVTHTVTSLARPNLVGQRSAVNHRRHAALLV